MAPRTLSSAVVTLLYSRYVGSAQGVIHHVRHEDAMGRNMLHPTVLRGDADSRALTVWSVVHHACWMDFRADMAMPSMRGQRGSPHHVATRMAF